MLRYFTGQMCSHKSSGVDIQIYHKSSGVDIQIYQASTPHTAPAHLSYVKK